MLISRVRGRARVRTAAGTKPAKWTGECAGVPQGIMGIKVWRTQWFSGCFSRAAPLLTPRWRVWVRCTAGRANWRPPRRWRSVPRKTANRYDAHADFLPDARPTKLEVDFLYRWLIQEENAVKKTSLTLYHWLLYSTCFTFHSLFELTDNSRNNTVTVWTLLKWSLCVCQGIDAINKSKVVELLKDGGCAGGDRRQSRDGVNGPGGPRGDCDGDEAEWSGVSGAHRAIDFFFVVAYICFNYSRLLCKYRVMFLK